MIQQDGFDFFGLPHGMVLPEGPFEVPLVVGRFFGVRGESHIVGQPWGRPLSCRLTLTDYASLDNLSADLATLASLVGTLTGELVETIGTSTRRFPHATFLGFAADGEEFYDGTGVLGWTQFGRLQWMQRDRSQ